MLATRTATPVADTGATATSAAIAELCDRLADSGTLEHPAVRCELRKLEELLITQADYAGHNPGRHRLPGTALHTGSASCAV